MAYIREYCKQEEKLASYLVASIPGLLWSESYFMNKITSMGLMNCQRTIISYVSRPWILCSQV